MALFDWLNRPEVSGTLLNLGNALLASSGSGPIGMNRGALFGETLARGNEATARQRILGRQAQMEGQRFGMERQKFDWELSEAERKRAQKEKALGVLQSVLGSGAFTGGEPAGARYMAGGAGGDISPDVSGSFVPAPRAAPGTVLGGQPQSVLGNMDPRSLALIGAYDPDLGAAVKPLMEMGQWQDVTLPDGRTGQRNRITGELKAMPNAPERSPLKGSPGDVFLDPQDPSKIVGRVPGGGPFQGTAMDAQAMNFMLMGEPSSPEYAAAYNYLAQPKTSFDASSGQLVTIRPDMSAYRAPARGGQTAQTRPQAQPAGAQPQSGSAAGVSITPVTAPKMNDEQSKAAGFADRIQNAEAAFAKVGQAGTDMSQKLLSQLPGGNYLLSPEYQQFDQASRDFVNAVLRRESGAVISTEEFANARLQYLPQPGDEPPVLAQKAQNRKTAYEAMMRSSGPGYKSAPQQVAPTAGEGSGQPRAIPLDDYLKSRGY